MREMGEKGAEPDVVTYTTLLNFYAKSDNEQRCAEIWDQMTEKGIEPDIVTYNTLLNFYVKCGNEQRCAEIWSEMTEKGIEPDIVTHYGLIDLKVNLSQIDQAIKIYEEHHPPAIFKDEMLDLHHLSHGTAVVAIIVTMRRYDRLTVICGKGLHKKNGEMYVMKNYLKEKLTNMNYEVEDGENLGLLVIMKK